MDHLPRQPAQHPQHQVIIRRDAIACHNWRPSSQASYADELLLEQECDPAQWNTVTYTEMYEGDIYEHPHFQLTTPWDIPKLFESPFLPHCEIAFLDPNIPFHKTVLHPPTLALQEW